MAGNQEYVQCRGARRYESFKKRVGSYPQAKWLLDRLEEIGAKQTPTIEFGNAESPEGMPFHGGRVPILMGHAVWTDLLVDRAFACPVPAIRAQGATTRPEGTGASPDQEGLGLTIRSIT